jgi:hypothetical protein
MMPKVSKLFRSWWLALSKEQSRLRTMQRRKPMVEALEDRCLPATFLWIGPAMNQQPNWSIADNWSNVDAIGNGVPRAGDSVIFDPSRQGKDGNPGTNTPSRDDLDGLPVWDMTINSGYTETITLTQSLTVTNTLTMYDGIVSTGNGTTWTMTKKGMVYGGTWTGAGTTVFDAHSILRIDGGVTINQTTVNLNGTTTWVTGTIHTNAAVITTTDLFEAQNNSKICYDGPGSSFNVTGTDGQFTKTGGAATGSTEIDIPFDVQSPVAPAVSIGAATLLLAGSGTSSSVFDTAANTMVDFTSFYKWEGGTAFTGPGFVAVDNNGEVLVDSDVPAVNVALGGGAGGINSTIEGTGTLTITRTLNWYSGTMKGNGTTTLLAGAVANLGNDANGAFPVVLDRRTLNINNNGQGNNPAEVNLGNDPLMGPGPITFQVDNGAVINNDGIFSVLDDSSIVRVNGSGISTFFNNRLGTWQKTGGMGTTRVGVRFINNGKYIQKSDTVDFNTFAVNQQNGLFDVGSYTTLAEAGFEQDDGLVTVDGGLLAVAGFYQENGGDLAIAGGSLGTFSLFGSFFLTGGAIDPGGLVTVTGTMDQTGGTVDVLYAVSTTDTYDLEGGSVVMDVGTLPATNGLHVFLDGILSGPGIINANVLNEGTLNVGDGSNSYDLTINGNYTQGAAGILTMTSPITESVLIVNGGASFDGTLNVPDVFPDCPIITYGSASGVFADVNFPGAPPPFFYYPDYEPTYFDIAVGW